jgi:hypothetical protein
MRVRWIHLSMGAMIEFPRWTLVPLIQVIPVPEGGGIIPRGEASHGNPAGPVVTFTLEGHHNEITGTEQLALELLDDQEVVVHSGLNSDPPQWYEVGPGYPLMWPGGISVGGWPIPRPGRYRFRLTIDGTPLQSNLEFYAQAGDTPIPPPADVPTEGFELLWSHIVEDVGGSGLPVLQRITEVVPIPPGAGVILNGYHAALIRGGSAIKRKQACQLELRDANGNLARRFDRGLISFGSAGPGHHYNAFVATKLRNVVLPRTGEWEFVVTLNGKRIGSSEVWLLPQH